MTCNLYCKSKPLELPRYTTAIWTCLILVRVFFCPGSCFHYYKARMCLRNPRNYTTFPMFPFSHHHFQTRSSNEIPGNLVSSTNCIFQSVFLYDLFLYFSVFGRSLSCVFSFFYQIFACPHMHRQDSLVLRKYIIFRKLVILRHYFILQQRLNSLYWAQSCHCFRRTDFISFA